MHFCIKNVTARALYNFYI